MAMPKPSARRSSAARVLLTKPIEIRGKVDITFEDMGSQSLKNIAEPMRVWRVRIGPSSSPAMLTKPPTETASPRAPDKPSIAVLPFTNMSGDPEQDYFADGMVEDIITALSHFKALFVIARNSSFTYKGRAVDVKQVGRELGVRYVLEGSVRKAANRVRITGQLVDTATGAHLWADRFDGGLGDIFDLQDQVTESVVGAIAPAVEKAEIERAKRKPTESLDAYALYLRGLARFYQFASRQANDEALRLFNSAIELDPDFASAYGRAASCYAYAKGNGWISVTANEIAEVTRLAQRAVELGKDDAIALAASGWALAYVVRDLEAGAALIDRALVLNSNLAEAWFYGGWVKNWLGEPEAAIERFARAMRLSPLDPRVTAARAGPRMHISSWAAMTKRHRGRQWHCRTIRTFNLDYVSPPQAMQWPDGRSKHIRQWLGCGNSIPRYVFPLSKTCWALIGVPKTSRDTKKDCGKPGCPNDHRSRARASCDR
jgi:TolB-like protein